MGGYEIVIEVIYYKKRNLLFSPEEVQVYTMLKPSQILTLLGDNVIGDFDNLYY